MSIPCLEPAWKLPAASLALSRDVALYCHALTMYNYKLPTHAPPVYCLISGASVKLPTRLSLKHTFHIESRRGWIYSRVGTYTSRGI